MNNLCRNKELVKLPSCIAEWPTFWIGTAVAHDLCPGSTPAPDHLQHAQGRTRVRTSRPGSLRDRRLKPKYRGRKSRSKKRKKNLQTDHVHGVHPLENSSEIIRLDSGFKFLFLAFSVPAEKWFSARLSVFVVGNTDISEFSLDL
jgi:hypothetical protein